MELKKEEPVNVIRCKDCCWYNIKKYICNKPFEALKVRAPDDYCSMARRRD